MLILNHIAMTMLIPFPWQYFFSRDVVFCHLEPANNPSRGCMTSFMLSLRSLLFSLERLTLNCVVDYFEYFFLKECFKNKYLKSFCCEQDTVVLWSNSSCIRSGGRRFESRRRQILGEKWNNGLETIGWKMKQRNFRKHDSNQGFQVVAPSSNIVKY